MILDETDKTLKEAAVTFDPLDKGLTGLYFARFSSEFHCFYATCEKATESLLATHFDMPHENTHKTLCEYEFNKSPFNFSHVRAPNLDELMDKAAHNLINPGQAKDEDEEEEQKDGF